MQINVFLCDPLEVTKVKNVPAEIQKYLQDKFDQVANAANNTNPRPNPAHTVKVQWSTTKPSPSDTDLVIYFLSTEVAPSIVSKFGGKTFDPLAHSHWGFTNFKTKTQGGAIIEAEAASEVYTKSHDGPVLGALAFHEAMHHKLLRGNELHNGNGLAQGTVEGTTQLTPQNITAMAAVLTRKIKQFTDGFDKLAAAKQRRDQGDPLWNILN
jgi:hypothetical protein